MKHVQIIEKNGVAVVSSRVVAQDFDKRHDHVLRDINNIIESNTTQNWGLLFIESQYKASNGKMNKEYLLTRDGFSLLVMGFTGKEALQWKLKYIEAFNKMEEMIKKQHNPFEGMSKELQAIFIIDHNQQEMDNRLTMLENKMTVDYGKQEELRVAISVRVYDLLGTAQDNSKLRAKVFAAIHRYIRKAFGVNSYKNIAVKQFENAKLLIEAWEPDEIMTLAIQGAKNQISLM